MWGSTGWRSVCRSSKSAGRPVQWTRTHTETRVACRGELKARLRIIATTRCYFEVWLWGALPRSYRLWKSTTTRFSLSPPSVFRSSPSGPPKKTKVMKSSSFLHIKREEVEKHGRERLQEARTAPFDWPVRTSGASVITLRTALLEQQPPPQTWSGPARWASELLRTAENMSGHIDTQNKIKRSQLLLLQKPRRGLGAAVQSGSWK